MKHLTTLLLILCISLPAWAVENTVPAPVEEVRYELWVSGTREGQTQTQYVNAATPEGISAADHSSLEAWLLSTFENNEDCTVSITVKVRVGWDSNFVEATGTVSGIPCSEIVEAIRNLREQLMAGIK